MVSELPLADPSRGLRLALFMPEIPHNTGTLLRLSACLGFGLDIIHPCGFVWHDKHLRRSGLDYHDLAMVSHFQSIEHFFEAQKQAKRRCVWVTTEATQPYWAESFTTADTLMMGQESTGFPAHLAPFMDHRVLIPMQSQRRSINMAIAAGIVVSEALRQTNTFPSR